ncbi:winged helix-turn-helix domain-containing protein [Schaalia hyovaginalis]|uniref:winged helix-turn-helix domain-containing protein n=1 Tax=Schaalia hyovaginalis TaxID=29316 RepID=UPI0012B1B67A|nr:winged helix-turn-helix domain-containing protein [Schaalia hyovaginalis]MST64425.1 winged helix-turn-helix transcriptional regulator [Schaalia hyovaginalis]
MTLVYTPAPSADIDDAPAQSFEDFLDVLAGLSLSPAHVDLDLDRRSLVIRGDRVRLCAKEFELLAHLAANADRAVSREELFATVWSGSGLGPESRTVDAHIRRLRKKIEAAPDLVTTVRGEGYRFNTTLGVLVRTSRLHTLAA